MGCSAVVSNTSCGVAKAQGNKQRFGAEREYQAQGTTPCHDTKGYPTAGRCGSRTQTDLLPLTSSERSRLRPGASPDGRFTATC